MQIYNPSNQLIIDTEVDDTSYRFKKIMGEDVLMIQSSLNTYIDIPEGSYCYYKGEPYTLMKSPAFDKQHTGYYNYSLSFEGTVDLLKTVKYKFFTVIRDPDQFVKLGNLLKLKLSLTIKNQLIVIYICRLNSKYLLFKFSHSFLSLFNKKLKLRTSRLCNYDPKFKQVLKYKHQITMRKKLIFLITFVLICYSCNVQKDNKDNESNQSTVNFDSYIKLDASTPRTEADAKFYEPWIDGNIVKTKVPATMQERLILNDEPVELILKNSNGIIYEQEASMIEVNGEHRIYYTGIANITKNYICFCTIDLVTGKITNHPDPVIGNGYGGAPSNREANCSHVFKNGNYIYCVATNGYGVRPDNGVFLYRSTDGINFEDLGALHNTSIAYNNFGNHWIIPEPINGEFYWFYEGRNNTIWETSVAKSTNIEGPYTNIGKINGLGSTGMAGGICVYYYNNKFRMFYHYGLNGTLPTVLGYSEGTLDDILNFTNIYAPLLDFTRKPWGDATDQIADPAVYEFNGDIYLIAEYTQNYPIFKSHLWMWKAPGLTLDKLFD